MSRCHHLCKFTILPELLIKLPFPDEKVGGWERGTLEPLSATADTTAWLHWEAATRVLCFMSEMSKCVTRCCQRFLILAGFMFGWFHVFLPEVTLHTHGTMVKSGTLAQLAA